MTNPLNTSNKNETSKPPLAIVTDLPEILTPHSVSDKSPNDHIQTTPTKTASVTDESKSAEDGDSDPDDTEITGQQLEATPFKNIQPSNGYNVDNGQPAPTPTPTPHREPGETKTDSTATGGNTSVVSTPSNYSTTILPQIAEQAPIISFADAVNNNLPYHSTKSDVSNDGESRGNSFLSGIPEQDEDDDDDEQDEEKRDQPLNNVTNNLWVFNANDATTIGWYMDMNSDDGHDSDTESASQQTIVSMTSGDNYSDASRFSLNTMDSELERILNNGGRAHSYGSAATSNVVSPSLQPISEEYESKDIPMIPFMSTAIRGPSRPGTARNSPSFAASSSSYNSESSLGAWVLNEDDKNNESQSNNLEHNEPTTADEYDDRLV